jgi:hypothetical protein
MRSLTCLLSALFGVLAIVASAWAQPAASIAVAADDDCIAVYSGDVERRLLRLRFDEAAGKVAFSLFGPPGVETFAVAPEGAFVVYAAIPTGDFERTPHLFLLDSLGRPQGKPVPSPIGAVAALAVSPRGDWIAASSERGWISLFAVERAGTSMRLGPRATFGASADRPYTYSFRPDGGLVTMTDDWVMTHRSSDGAIQRVVDLKTLNRTLEPASRDSEGLFRLRWSPRGDRFTVSWGGGPMMTTIFDESGHRVQPAGLSADEDLPATDVAFIDGGNAAILTGMADPVVVGMASLASKPFANLEINATHFLALSGGRRLMTLDDNGVALWSDAGKQLIAPATFENYAINTAAAGANNEAIVAAGRGGWIDLFTKEGAFVRRVQSGTAGPWGRIAVSADGDVVSALGRTELYTLIRPEARAWRATIPFDQSQRQFVATAATGNRIAAVGPGPSVLTWSRDGGDVTTYVLEADGQRPDRPAGFALSPEGDAMALVDERAAIWLIRAADRSVRRVALPARSWVVAPLPQGGFAAGLADGTIVRLSPDGTFVGPPVKAAEFGGVGLIAVAPDGESFIVVEDDELSVRHLDWNGKVLAGPLRTSRSDRIQAAFFRHDRPVLILAPDKSSIFAGDGLALVDLVAGRAAGRKHFEQPN